MNFSLAGVDEAFANVRAVAASITERTMQVDGLAALEPVVADARSLAPVGEGDLRDSIEAVTFPDGTIGVIIGDWKGHFWEFGTVHHRAQPMLVPAFDANEAVVIEILSGRVVARIEGAL